MKRIPTHPLQPKSRDSRQGFTIFPLAIHWAEPQHAFTVHDVKRSSDPSAEQQHLGMIAAPARAR